MLGPSVPKMQRYWGKRQLAWSVGIWTFQSCSWKAELPFKLRVQMSWGCKDALEEVTPHPDQCWMRSFKVYKLTYHNWFGFLRTVADLYLPEKIILLQQFLWNKLTHNSGWKFQALKCHFCDLYFKILLIMISTPSPLSPTNCFLTLTARKIWLMESPLTLPQISHWYTLLMVSTQHNSADNQQIKPGQGPPLGPQLNWFRSGEGGWEL